MNFDISQWKMRNVSEDWILRLIETFDLDKQELESLTLNKAQYSALCTNQRLSRDKVLSTMAGVRIKVL
jgi:hypothetical protein